MAVEQKSFAKKWLWAISLAVMAAGVVALILWLPAGFYLWLKAFHIIAVISWMAGMLYLPRLFVYHCDAPKGSPQSETFKIMEPKLLTVIINPGRPPGQRIVSAMVGGAPLDDAKTYTLATNDFVANGGDGCMSVVSNVAPDLCQAIFSNYRQGRLQSARYLQSRLAPLTAALTKENPAALKYALCLLGFMSPATRLPIVELTEADKAEVASAIAAIGDEAVGCPVENRHGRRLRTEAAAST